MQLKLSPTYKDPHSPPTHVYKKLNC